MTPLEDLGGGSEFNGACSSECHPMCSLPDSSMAAARSATPARNRPPSCIGQWLSMHLIEPYFAFDDSDYAAADRCSRAQAWPDRRGRDPA